MKKLLLFIAILAAVTCFFTVAVSAQTKTTVNGEVLTVTTYDDAPTKNNIVVSTDDLVVFDDGFVCPSAYVFKDNKTSMWNGNGNASIVDALDFSFVNGNVVKIDCTPATDIFMTGMGRNFRFANTDEGEVTHAEFRLDKQDIMFRITVRDKFGNNAHTHYYKVEDLWENGK